MKTTWWKSGSSNAICDRCGRKFKREDLRETWDGLMVCQDDWEPKHPQLMLRPIPDQQKLPWTRPEPSDITAYSNVCTVKGSQGIAGYAIAGCARAGVNYGVTGNLSITSNG